MHFYKKIIKTLISSSLLIIILSSCSSSSPGRYGRKLTEGTKPINSVEDKAYQKSLLRCYKTGGTRIVKIRGVLKCY